MARRTFFSFHYVLDNWRAWNVRNSWVIRPHDQIDVGFFDSSAVEAKKKDDALLKDFLREALDRTTVTCLLAGRDTWSRRWVRYEIARSITKGNGLLNVHIHSVRDRNGQVASKGLNPLDYIGVYKSNGNVYLAEMNGDRWVKFNDYTRPIPENDLWFSAPISDSVTPISRHTLSYDFSIENGRANIGSWIEAAARAAGH